jgi:hypothetical protein
VCGRFLAGWFDYVFEAIESADGRYFGDCLDGVATGYGSKLSYLVIRVRNVTYTGQGVRSRLMVWMRKGV